MLVAQTHQARSVSLVCLLVLAVPAAAQLPPDLVEEGRRIGAALEPAILELSDPQYVFEVPEPVRVIHVTANRLEFSTAGIQALDRWLQQPGHVLWVDIATSAALFGLPVGPPQPRNYADSCDPRLALPTDGHPLLADVQHLRSRGWVLYRVPPQATPIVRQGRGIACAVYPYGEGTVLFLPPLADHPTGMGFPPGILDNDQFVLNLGRWLCALTGTPVPALPLARGAAEVGPGPAEPAVAGWTTCPHCGYRFAPGGAAPVPVPATPPAGL